MQCQGSDEIEKLPFYSNCINRVSPFFLVSTELCPDRKVKQVHRKSTMMCLCVVGKTY